MWIPSIMHDPLRLVRDFILLEHNWQLDCHLLICTYLYNGRVYGSYNIPRLIYYSCPYVHDHVLFVAKRNLNWSCDWN